MSCNHCTTKFNFFHKEMGCSNCGLSFCNKCLKQKCKIPSKGPGEFSVCKICYAKLTAGTSSNQTSVPPPDAYIKSKLPNPPHKSLSKIPVVNSKYYFDIVLLRRLEALENPSAPPITMYKNDPKLQNLRTGLSPADQQLIDRLEKLKEDKNKHPPPTEGELRRRLANLKGENNYVEGPSKQVFAVDTRSDQQKVDDLLEYFNSEREIELAHNPQGEIEARLASLREQGVRPNEGAYISNLHDSSSSEEEVDRITKKIMDEVALDERCPILVSKVPSNSLFNESDDDRDITQEMPWCVICNEDAKYRCLTCDGDLYCASCNKEQHDDTSHRIVRYKRK